eukprot:1338796-Prymnesium_polylepis.1
MSRRVVGALLALLCLAAGAPVVPDDCVDRDPECGSWATVKECETSPEVMQRECARTCNLCGTDVPDCVDRRAECEEWVALGLCIRSPHAMLE